MKITIKTENTIPATVPEDVPVLSIGGTKSAFGDMKIQYLD